MMNIVRGEAGGKIVSRTLKNIFTVKCLNILFSCCKRILNNINENTIIMK